MDNATIAIIVTAVTAVMALGWTVLGQQRLRGTRHLMQGLGLTLIPIGLQLSGIMELLVSGAKGVYRFFRDTTVDTLMTAGLIVLALGAVLFIAASLVKPRTREESRQLRLARAEKSGPAVETGRPAAGRRPAVGGAAPADSATTTTPVTRAKPASAKGLDDEDAEIEALLRKRGIE